jgi:hypothetical protein
LNLSFHKGGRSPRHLRFHGHTVQEPFPACLKLPLIQKQRRRRPEVSHPFGKELGSFPACHQHPSTKRRRAPLGFS